ncbi:MAG: ATP-binding cassette domain-containing protein [Ignavibacteriae bacterium]|nr:ATP-binding cassette domain-containing protein [Ignavibacteriota bacterium]
MLEVKKISKYFNSNLVLNNVSLNVSEGIIFGLLGPNGAGKTTMLRIILNILIPSSGTIAFNNSEISETFFNQTGYLPEERGLYPKSSVKNILHYMGKLKGLSNKEVEERTNYWLDRLELNSYRKHKLEELSKGNQQKIQFITAILHNPKLLILDEPFSGFDPVNQNIFKDIIVELSEDRFIILSTHLMDLAESLCDEILLLDNGIEIESGNLQDILNLNNNETFNITCSNKITSETFNKFEDVKIISSNLEQAVISLGKLKPDEFIKRFSQTNNIEEFSKVKSSLHQTFLSLVNSKVS